MTERKLLCWGKMIAAFIFLFNPNFNLIDILPDAVGYFLLLLAIRDAVGIFPHFGEAHSGFQKLFWLNLCKIPALFVMLLIIGVNNYERSIITVFALSFAILEIIFALPAFRAFFEGFIHLGEREGLLPALQAGKHKRGVGGVASFTVIFLLCKAALSFLPEISLLSVFETLGEVEIGAVNPVRFYPFLLVGALLIGFAVGGLWLFFASSYIHGLKNSTVMNDFLASRAVLVSDRVHLAAKKNSQKLAFAFLTAALIFAFDLPLDNTNYLPDAFSGICLLLSFFFLQKESRSAKYGMLFSALYTVCAAVLFGIRASYFAQYTYMDAAYRTEAASRYLVVEILAVVEMLLLTAAIVALFRALRDCINGNAGKAVSAKNENITSSIRKELSKKLSLFTAAGIFCALYHAAETFALTMTERHVVTAAESNQYYAAGTVIYYPLFGGSWFIGALFTALWFSLGIYFLHSLREEIGTEEID